MPAFPRFIAEPITVAYANSPLLEKKPACPDAFQWRGTTFNIIDMLAEWHDYRRRGRMARNMQPQHLAVASHRGSWGVGRFYFKVLTGQGRVFELYYDRSPRGSDDRKGSWVLYREWVEAASA